VRPAALLWPRSPAALAGSLAALVAAATRVALVPLVVLPLFDRVLVGEVGALPGVVALTGVVVVAGALALWAQDALFGAAAAALSARWRRRLYRRLLDRPPGTLPGSSGGTSSRILSDLREVEVYLQYGLGSVVAESATTLGIVGYLVFTDAHATGLLLLFALPTALALRLVGARIERSAGAVQVATEELGRHLQEGFRHHALVRAFRARALMLRRFEPANTAAERSASRRSLLAGMQVPLSQLLIFGAFVVLVLLLVDRVQEGAMSEGELVAFVTLVALLGTPLQLLPKALAMQQQARAGARRLLDLLGAPSAPEVPTRSAPIPREVTYTLTGVTAGYGAGPVLRGIDLTLPTRGLVVVRGESGAGKSSLLRLLLGFLPPSTGEVRFAGVPLDELDPDALAERVGYVPQDAALLSGSLRENLLLGRNLPDATLWEALDGVGIAATVRGLPRGLDHPLSEDGGGLSGGQQQRLAVARALLSDPTALLLDEPTANLDGESERALVVTLQREAQRRLVLAVAHGPALLEAADLTITMSDGAIAPGRSATP
jgi:ATP-binding cassette subfamily B protein